MLSGILNTSTLKIKPNRLSSTQLVSKGEDKAIFKIVRWSWIVLIIASILQCVLFQSITNFIAVGCVVLAWMVTTIIFLRPDTIKNYPLSSFIILGFSSTQFYFPLIFTIVEGKPVIYNLELPLEVFFHSTLALIVITTAHLFYQLIFKKYIVRNNILLTKANFFKPPSDIQMWLMGVIGLISTYYVYIHSPDIGWSPTGAASDKAIQSLIPFMYAPYFIPFSHMYGKNKSESKSLVLLLIIFTALVFMVSIGRNSRASFMVGFASVGFTYGLGILLDYYKPRIFTKRNVLIVLGVLWLFIGPIADIGTAMVIVRGQRHDISYNELLQLTLEAFEDKESIRLRRLVDVTEKHDWDEIYLDNIFIQRFSNLKFNDASLVLASEFGEHDPDMLNFTIDHFLATLPLPVIEFLDLNVDKNLVTSGSYGDYFYYLVSGDPNSLKGFRTAHFAGTGMAAFGWWYLLILGAGMIPVFLLYDKLCTKKITAKCSYSDVIEHKAQFSFCGLLVLTSIFQFLSPAESVEGIASFLLRGWIQLILSYYLVYHFTLFLSILIKNRKQIKVRKVL